MNKLLENIFTTGKFVNSKGEEIQIYGETERPQCEFLQSLVKENKFKKSLEIGFAFGMSALSIVEEVSKNGGRHLVIDKFQTSDWGGNGLDLITQAGYKEKTDFRENYCYEVLPELLARREKFDFVYIDSTKQFDWLMMDFFFIDRLLEVNGIVVFDDVGYYSVRKLVRYITQYPSYKIVAQFPGNVKPGFGASLMHKVSSIPGIRSIFKQSLTVADYKQGINSRCIALRKTDEDKRRWDWYAPF
ncbi:MAG: class I SAM-dependent methyltransferase [Chitinophagaceae bacterium]|nr:class I SAM-dependent methyltransferase [Chitinophagaceae bacterium]